MATNGYAPRIKERYESELRPALKEELGLKSVMQVPRITKITLNMGVGEAKNDAKLLDQAVEELTTIASSQSHCRASATSAASALPRSTAAGTTRSASASRSSFRRSTTTTSKR